MNLEKYNRQSAALARVAQYDEQYRLEHPRPEPADNRMKFDVDLADVPASLAQAMIAGRRANREEGEIIVLGDGGGILIRVEKNSNSGGSQSRY
jgi:hypothetical protein